MELRDQLQQTLGSAYTIERELGGGGMSRVFLAEETALGRRVVIKVLPPETAAQVSLERFKREIMLAARLQHPHIVPLHSAGESNGLPYFTMPFVEGESLRARLARHGELPVNDAIRILREIAAALGYAHERGIVHRDIKPDNVLLSGGSAMVTDFGVAKALSASSNADHGGVTSLGVALGTPAYMAPEQATADPSIDHRADVYAFGVLAYELLTGQPPFVGRTPQNLLAAHVTEAPESIGKRRSSLPPALSALVMQCLEKRPADRPQSAAEIVHALDGIATPSGGMQPTTGLPTRAAGPSQQTGRVRVLGSAVVLVLVFIGVMLARRGRGGSSPDVPTAGTAKSIAVLPFVNLSGDTAYAYFAEGISDQLRSDLTGLAGLKVMGHASSIRFQKDNLDPREAGAKMGVSAVVAGSVSRSGKRLRITAELVSVADGAALSSMTFERQVPDLAAIQDSITRTIAGKLEVSLSAARSDTAIHGASRGTTNLDAYDLYLRGRYAFDRSENARAIDLLTSAVAKDPKFGRAYALLAMTYYSQTFEGFGSPDSLLALARTSVTKATALGSVGPDAALAQAAVQRAEWKFAQADSTLAKASQANPENGDLHNWRSGTLGLLGREADAVAEARRASELDSLNEGTAVSLQWYLFMVRDYGASILQMKRILALDPSKTNRLNAYQQLSLIYAFAGRPDSAVLAVEKSLALDSTTYGGRIYAVFGYAAAGRWKDARAQRLLLERERGGNSPNYQRVFIDISFGQLDSAMLELERAVTGREPLVQFDNVSCDPVFDPLKRNPRFGALMNRIGASICPASGRWPIASPPK
jgi:eukaryotic-like serine/threonine-protein kinase